MPLPHSIVVTPSTSFLPSDTNLSSTPPPPSNAHAAARPHTSPSPRTRLPDRDFASPASSNTHHHRPHRSVDGSSAENHPGPPSPHITFASTTAPPPNFIAASSLLPHAWIADSASSRESSPHTRHLPHEPSPPSGTPEQAKELEPPRARGHSRSSSAGGLSDGIRNLNRWSASTTSSRASNLTGFTRRISVDVFGAVTGSPGRKLHKSRPSTSSVSPRSGDAAQARSESPPPAPVPPLQSLPRISIGPSLEEEVRQANVLGRDSPIQRPRYIRRPSHDSAFYWDGAPQIPEEHSGLSSQLDSAESLLPAATITPGLTMPYNQNGGEPRGHSRSRSTGANGSADTTSSSVSRNRDRDRDRDRDIDRNRDRDRDISSATNKPPSQKAMLSKALKKAQSAVQLDNAQNAEGARSAYSEACTLLQHVLRRTTAEEDRRKLEAIHTTYTSRIAELEEQLYALIQDRREPSTQQSENDDVPVYMGAQIDYRQDDERGKTEAEFDAALDDAIEAAYDDGYEQEAAYGGDVYRRVELARRRVRESEREAREALELANAREQKLRLQQQLEDEEYRKQEGLADEFYDDGNDSEEEERVLEEMTRGYAIEDFALRTHQKTAIPRESDSSGMTSRTWHTSISSNPQTATTVLTPVSEVSMHPQPTGPLPPPPTGALPQVPQQPSSAGSQASTLSVQNRRLSSHNLKQLKIETTTTTQSVAPATAGPAFPQQQQKTSSYIVQQRQALSAGPNRTTDPLSLRPSVSPAPGHLSCCLAPRATGELFIDELKEHQVTESSSAVPAIDPNPLGGFRDRADTFGSGGMHLFNDEIHSPNELGSPNLLLADAPVPLEPCPNDVMLRPFWLMRCLYQTLCHPHGGYLSNKLFVPRDVWRVKGVKLKNIEDKIANCDYLTAALQKLSLVDTCDADAVLEEMQALEGVLEQVQATLTRKLGSEVGVQSTNVMFKDAAMVENESTTMPRSGSVSAKNSSFSWRRLRSKNSSANLPGLASSYGGKGGSGGASTPIDGSVGNVLLPSLPMTTHPTTRPTKRDVGMVQFAGPNANYMSSLARLFDAAQCIDQIARQVDDPGLRHADKTQVGLELCTRHAAEFFGFFICRFVMSDLMLMLDKFLKRGSEWVIA
ncbi:hypothetical protein B0T17DRAFT_619933 [Bombardia bombarda]|uniref:MIT domain-containing protein n=1 Tax=Bombardia bombarda TaxID=252184 RepID=A0AA39WGT0_9PEZI|nr:hypothetical protein B0T17DRAFT_619933 [Bombardia bombarda]